MMIKTDDDDDEKEIKNKDPLDNIIGLESVKEEIRYYMDFIKNRR